MKVRVDEKVLNTKEDDLDNFEKDYENQYTGGVQKIKTAIGKMRKSEDSMYKNNDSKRFKKK